MKDVGSQPLPNEYGTHKTAQARFDHDFKAQVVKTFQVVPSSFGSGKKKRGPGHPTATRIGAPRSSESPPPLCHPRYSPTAGSYEGKLSYGRGAPAGTTVHGCWAPGRGNRVESQMTSARVTCQSFCGTSGGGRRLS